VKFRNFCFKTTSILVLIYFQHSLLSWFNNNFHIIRINSLNYTSVKFKFYILTQSISTTLINIKHCQPFLMIKNITFNRKLLSFITFSQNSFTFLHSMNKVITLIFIFKHSHQSHLSSIRHFSTLISNYISFSGF